MFWAFAYRLYLEMRLWWQQCWPCFPAQLPWTRKWAWPAVRHLPTCRVWPCLGRVRGLPNGRSNPEPGPPPMCQTGPVEGGRCQVGLSWKYRLNGLSGHFSSKQGKWTLAISSYHQPEASNLKTSEAIAWNNSIHEIASSPVGSPKNYYTLVGDKSVHLSQELVNCLIIPR